MKSLTSAGGGGGSARAYVVGRGQAKREVVDGLMISSLQCQDICLGKGLGEIKMR